MPRLRVRREAREYDTTLIREYVIYTNVDLFNEMELPRLSNYLVIQGISKVGEAAGAYDACLSGFIRGLPSSMMSVVGDLSSHVDWLTDEDVAQITEITRFEDGEVGFMWAYHTPSRALVEKVYIKLGDQRHNLGVIMGWLTHSGSTWCITTLSLVDPLPSELSIERGWSVIAVDTVAVGTFHAALLAPTDLSVCRYLQRVMSQEDSRQYLPVYDPRRIYCTQIGARYILILPWKVVGMVGTYYPVSPRGREIERINTSPFGRGIVFSHGRNDLNYYWDIVDPITRAGVGTFPARMVDGTSRSREMIFETELLNNMNIGRPEDLIRTLGLSVRPVRPSQHAVSSVGSVPAFVMRAKNPDFDGRRPFGVEIETIGLGDHYIVEKLAKDKKHKVYSVEYSHHVRDYWKVVPDGSLHNGGGELVSPPLRGLEGLDEMKDILSDLPEYNVGVDSSCGVHVHHAYPLDDRSAPAVKRLLKAYGYFESKVIDYLVTPSRRGNGNSYCMPISHMTGLERMEGNFISVSHMASNISRYFKVNICPLNTYGTVEFRHHHGCIDPNDVANWVIFTQMMMQGAVRNDTDDLSTYSPNWKGLMSWMFAASEPGKYALEALTALERRYVGNKSVVISSSPGSIGRVFTGRDEGRLPAMEDLPSRIEYDIEDEEDDWETIDVCSTCGINDGYHEQNCLTVIDVPCQFCGQMYVHSSLCEIVHMRRISVDFDGFSEATYREVMRSGRIYWVRDRSIFQEITSHDRLGMFVEVR